jgi:Antitoxin ParD
MSRLTIEITEQQHQSIKAMAALNGKSIKEYTLERLFGESYTEEKAMQELKGLLHDRIVAAERGELSSMTFDDILEHELQRGVSQ